VTIRMSRADAAVTLNAARRAGLPLGTFIAGLAAGVPVLSAGSGLADHATALKVSCAEMSTLSRNVRQLTRLLREGNVHAALEYRDVLITLDRDVRGHLMLAAGVLADLRPKRRASDASKQTLK